MPRWSSKEEDTLRRVVPKVRSWKRAQHYLPNHNTEGIRRHARTVTPTVKLGSALKEGDTELPLPTGGPPRPLVQGPGANLEAKPEQVWEDWARMNRPVISRIKDEGDFFCANPRPGQPLCIAFPADQHISAGAAVDLDQMKADAQFIADTDGLYAMCGGDGIDAHCKHLSGVISAKSTVAEEAKLYEHYLDILRDKLLGVVSGNHDAFPRQISGADPVSALAQKLGVPYAPDEARLRIDMDGDLSYQVVLRHQYRGGRKPIAAVEKMYDEGRVQFDVGVVCHQHELFVGTFMRHDLPRVALRPGSYQLRTDFTRQYGFGISIPRCPAVVLLPTHRELVPFADMYQAVRYMDYLTTE